MVEEGGVLQRRSAVGSRADCRARSPDPSPSWTSKRHGELHLHLYR
jgi:hypothetical protein